MLWYYCRQKSSRRLEGFIQQFNVVSVYVYLHVGPCCIKLYTAWFGAFDYRRCVHHKISNNRHHPMTPCTKSALEFFLTRELVLTPACPCLLRDVLGLR